jgi:hypothetical protein
MSEMSIMDPTGHTSVTWAPDNSAEVASARETFDAMTAKGYRAFRVDRKGRQSEQMRSFDPSAEEMILIPQLQGG